MIVSWTVISAFVCGLSHGFLDPVQSGVGDLHSQVFSAIEKIGILEQQVASLKAENDKIPRLEAEVAALKVENNKIPKLEAELWRLSKLQNESTGAVYTRWGRTTCPSNATQLLYTGYTAGSKRTMTGGPANTLCLPKDPVWERYSVGVQGGSAVYAIQYDFMDDSKIGDLDPNQTNDYFTPCAVCNHLAHTSVYMVPGKQSCHPGWTLEYKGYLMSDGNPQNKASTEYICVDGDPERLEHDSKVFNSKVLFHTEATCEGLACPPYVSGRELTCAVCSK